jgi:hypothetical protein
MVKFKTKMIDWLVSYLIINYYIDEKKLNSKNYIIWDKFFSIWQ